MDWGFTGIFGRALELPAGSVVDIAPTGRARLRFNEDTLSLELSVSGGAYAPIAGGGGGSPVGPDDAVQFNAGGGAFGGSAELLYPGSGGSLVAVEPVHADGALDVSGTDGTLGVGLLAGGTANAQLVGIGRGTNNGVIVQVADGGEFPFTVSKGLFGASEFLLQAVAGVAAGDGTFTVGNGIGIVNSVFRGRVTLADTGSNGFIRLTESTGPAALGSNVVDMFAFDLAGDTALVVQTGNGTTTLLQAGLAMADLSRSGTVAQVSALSATPAGQWRFVTDEVGGPTPAYSDGTDWRRVADRAIITT